MFKNLSLSFKISMALLIPLLTMLIISNVINITYVRNTSKKLSYKIVEETAQSEAALIKSSLEKDLNNVTGVKYIMESMYNSGVRNREEYEQTVYNFFNSLPQTVIGLMLTFEPNIIGQDSDYINKYTLTKGQQSYYVSRSEGKVYSKFLSYNELQEDYYQQPIKTGKEYLTGVYPFDVGNGNIIQMYTLGVPIIVNNKVIGALAIDVNIETLNGIMAGIHPFENSEGLLYDHLGNILYNEGNSAYLGKNMYDVFPKYRSHNILEDVSAGKTVFYEEYTDYYKGNATYLFVPLEIVKGQYWVLEILAANSSIFKDSNAIRLIMIIMSVFIVIASAFIIPFIIKTKVNSTIMHLSDDIDKLSNGDISWEAPKNVEGEWAKISNNFEKTLNNLNNVVTTVKHSADQVSYAANEVLTGNNDLSARTELQASSIEETAASMNEIASMVKESVSNVSQSTDLVSKTKNYLDKAGGIVKTSVNNMNDVYEASSKIMDITKLIENIAFQTNILALNASVEAARAGTEGKGFAVVASEIRNLAQNTQESVKNITDLINDSNTKINIASVSVKETDEIFAEISENMDIIYNLMDKVNTASQEQERGIEQINIAINKLDSSVQQNASLVEEVTSASESLLSESQELVKSISYFTLKENNQK